MKLMVFILLFSVKLFSQEIGFIIDGTGMVTDKKPMPVMPISGFDIFGNVRVIQELQIELRTGYEIGILESYRGWEASIYVLYKLLPPFYLIGGVNYHANDGSSGNYEYVAEKSITMPGLGAGVDITSLFSFELIYHQLLKKEFWESTRDAPFSESHMRYLHGVIKANFKFRWQL